MKVKAAVAHSRNVLLAIEGLELDEPRSDEILVRLVACGVSLADLAAIDGRLAMPLPFVPGSEGAGIVERVGINVTHVAPGDSVVVSFAWCGHCENCAAGRPRACTYFAGLNLSGRRLDGSTPFVTGNWEVNGSFFGQSSFATHMICRATSAIAVPAHAPLEVLAAFGGELLLGAGTVLHAFRVQPNDSLLVMGADVVGLVATMIAKARGVSVVVVVDADETRQSIASQLGATIVVHPDEGLGDLVRSIAADGVRFALCTRDDPAARLACLDSLARGGACAFVRPALDEPTDFDDQVAADADAALVLSVDGHAPPAILVPELMRLRDLGLFPVERLLDFFPFEHVNDALAALRAGKVVKPILRFRLGAFDDLDRSNAAGAGNEATEDSSRNEGADTSERNALVKS